MLFETHFQRAFGSKPLRLAALGAAAAASVVAATHPAAASDALAILTSTVKCATSAACVIGANTNSGPGVAGTSAKGTGVSGTTTSGSYGVLGVSTNTNGVAGYSHSGGGSVGVYGSSPQGYGVYGYSPSSGGYGVEGYGSSIGTYGYSPSGEGLYGYSGSGYGLRAYGGNAGVVTNASYIGLLSGATSFPLVLQNGSGNDVFYVSSAGNVYYSGSFISFARVSNGATVNEYSAKTAAPTLEDTGTAQLVAGVAQVRLDPTFAAGLDPRVAYRVFVTPRGDTRGLYVAAAGPAGFTVRENQAGRSSASFDYRIVATEAGHVGERMAAVNTALMPHVAQQSAVPALKAQPAP